MNELIIYKNLDGSTKSRTNDPIVAYSNAVNVYKLIAPFANTSAITANFTLDNKSIVPKIPMTLSGTEEVDVNGTPTLWNVWEYPLDEVILSEATNNKFSNIAINSNVYNILPDPNDKGDFNACSDLYATYQPGIPNPLDRDEWYVKVVTPSTANIIVDLVAYAITTTIPNELVLWDENVNNFISTGIEFDERVLVLDQQTTLEDFGVDAGTDNSFQDLDDINTTLLILQDLSQLNGRMLDIETLLGVDGVNFVKQNLDYNQRNALIGTDRFYTIARDGTGYFVTYDQVATADSKNQGVFVDVNEVIDVLGFGLGDSSLYAGYYLGVTNISTNTTGTSTLVTTIANERVEWSVALNDFFGTGLSFDPTTIISRVVDLENKTQQQSYNVGDSSTEFGTKLKVLGEINAEDDINLATSKGLKSIDLTTASKEVIAAINALSDELKTRGLPNGLAEYDATGKVSRVNLPTGMSVLKGTFGSSGSTTLGDLPESGNLIGDTYICDEDDFVSAISGFTYNIGDYALFDTNSTWVKVDHTESVSSVNGKIGVVILVKADLGLGNVDNTADIDKPVSTFQELRIQAVKFTDAGDTPSEQDMLDNPYFSLVVNADGDAIKFTRPNNNSSFSVITGCLLSRNATNINTFDISPGEILEIDTSTTDFSLSNVRNFAGAVQVTPTAIGSGEITYISIAWDGIQLNINQRNNQLSPEQRRSEALIGSLSHFDNITIQTVIPTPISSQQPLNQAFDFHDLIKKKQGLIVTGSIGLASFDMTAGKVVGPGLNAAFNPNSPNVKDINSAIQLSFIPTWRDGTGGLMVGTPTSIFNPTLYDDGTGVLAAIGNPTTQAAVHRIFIGTGGTIFVAYGQNVWTSVALANSARTNGTDLLDGYPINLLESSVVIGIVSMAAGATDFSDIASAIFITPGESGAASSGASIGSTIDSNVAISSSFTRLIGNTVKQVNEFLDVNAELNTNKEDVFDPAWTEQERQEKYPSIEYIENSEVKDSVVDNNVFPTFGTTPKVGSNVVVDVDIIKATNELGIKGRGDDITHWQQTNATSLTLVDDKATLELSANTSVRINIDNTMVAEIGDVIYVKCLLDTNDSTATSILAQLRDGSGGNVGSGSDTDTFANGEKSFLITITNDANLSTLQFIFSNDGLQTGNTLQVTKVIMVNLTKQGSGLTQVDADIIFPYFENTQSTSFEIVSRAKNIFNGELESGSFSNGEPVPDTSIRSIDFISVEEILYRFSSDLGYAFALQEYDINFNFIQSRTVTSFTPIAGVAYVKFRTSTTNQDNLAVKIQLEKGGIATVIDPYTEVEDIVGNGSNPELNSAYIYPDGDIFLRNIKMGGINTYTWARDTQASLTLVNQALNAVKEDVTKINNEYINKEDSMENLDIFPELTSVASEGSQINQEVGILRAVNMLGTHDFVNSLNGVGSASALILATNDGIVLNLNTGQDKIFTFTNGNKYYVKTMFDESITTGNITNLRIYDDSSSSILESDPASVNGKTYSGLIDFQETTQLGRIAWSTTGVGDFTHLASISIEIPPTSPLFNLTLEELDDIFPKYFENTQTTNFELVSRGNNILPFKFSQDWVLSSGSNGVGESYVRPADGAVDDRIRFDRTFDDLIDIKGDTTFTGIFKNSGTMYNFAIFEYDVNGTLNIDSGWQVNGAIWTVQSDTTKISFLVRRSDNGVFTKEDFQLNGNYLAFVKEGNAYEEYKESSDIITSTNPSDTETNSVKNYGELFIRNIIMLSNKITYKWALNQGESIKKLSNGMKGVKQESKNVLKAIFENPIMDSNVLNTKDYGNKTIALSESGIRPYVSPEGTRLVYVHSTGIVKTRLLPIPYDLSRTLFDGNIPDDSSKTSFLISCTGIEFVNGGTRFIALSASNNKMYQWDLTVPYDTNTSGTRTEVDLSTEAGFPYDFAINKQGDTLYLLDRSSEAIYEYKFDVVNSIAGMDYLGNSFDISYISGNKQGIVLTDDGTKLLFGGIDETELNEIVMSIPNDITSASIGGNLFIDSFSSGPISFSLQGSHMYVGSEFGTDITQLTLYANTNTLTDVLRALIELP